MSLDVLLLAKADYSNVGYLYAEALQSVGVNAEAWAVNPSPRKYDRHAYLFNSLKDDVLPLAQKAKAILFMHSRLVSAINIEDKFITVFHGGSRYRNKPEKMNQIFNPIVDKSIIQTGDLLDLGAKNQVWILPCIETELFAPDYERHDSKRIIAHYPHKGYVKGTETIYNVLTRLEDNDVYCNNKEGWKWYINDITVSWEDNLRRIAGCDIYIEATKSELREKPYGEWGLTALEAAALGRVVITHFRSYERYLKEYGPCPLVIANNERELEAAVRKVLEMSWDEINDLKRATRAWAEKYHSLKVIGQRLKEEVYNEI